MHLTNNEMCTCAGYQGNFKSFNQSSITPNCDYLKYIIISIDTAAPPPGDGEYYSYPEISLAHGKAAQPNTHMQTSENAYQSLIPGNEDYIHMYSRTIPSLGKEPVTDSVGSNRGHPTPQNDGQLDTLQVTESAIPVARHIYAAIDPGQIQPPNEYAQLQTP